MNSSSPTSNTSRFGFASAAFSTVSLSFGAVAASSSPDNLTMASSGPLRDHNVQCHDCLPFRVLAQYSSSCLGRSLRTRRMLDYWAAGRPTRITTERPPDMQPVWSRIPARCRDRRRPQEMTCWCWRTRATGTRPASEAIRTAAPPSACSSRHRRNRPWPYSSLAYLPAQHEGDRLAAPIRLPGPDAVPRNVAVPVARRVGVMKKVPAPKNSGCARRNAIMFLTNR